MGSFPGVPQLETRKALLLIDLQNDFVNPNGKLHVKNVADFLPRLPELVSTFRESGEIIWIQTQFTEPRATISPDLGSYSIVLKDLLAAPEEDDFDEENSLAYDGRVPEADPGTEDPEAFLAPRTSERPSIARCCLPGTLGSRLPESLASSVDPERDVVLTKSHYSAFADASFLLNLRKTLVVELYLCGSLSNISVYATALDAVRHGLSVIVVEDCVGYRNETCHKEAMRQMADGMGAEGVELQELVDDLNGDLGDVITEDTFPTRFEVRLSDPKRSSETPRLSPSVQQWMSRVETQSSTKDHPAIESIEGGVERSWQAPNPSQEFITAGTDPAMTPDLTGDDSQLATEPPISKTEVVREGTPVSLSPPRKRSTDIDFEQQEPKAMYASARHRLSEEAAVAPSKQPKPKTNRIRMRKRKPKEDATAPGTYEKAATLAPSSGNDGGQGLYASSTQQSAPHLENGSASPVVVDPTLQNRSMPNLGSVVEAGSGHHSPDRSTPAAAPPVERASSSRACPAGLMPSSLPEREHARSKATASSIGEGDSHLCYNLLPPALAAQAFHSLRFTAQWQKMHHRSGEVPRLVAVQGEVNDDSSIPIYRHPADESPKLVPFSSSVQRLRECVEKVLQHPVNHVLIQLYRNGEDNISEHSDKTLDIVRGSDIVNLSLGAQRTMVLRAKKAADSASGQPRLAQRIPLPHNSLFILGPKTNQHWLHAIRADKRRTEEKSAAELDYGSERISLTFRYVGTFISPVRGMIWGQGATAKERQMAQKILSGVEAERAGEAMIRAFGQENHRSHDFDWETYYGTGFDVVNFVSIEAPEGGAS